MWKEILKIIANEKRQYNESLNKGIARDDIINALSTNLNKIFIPEPYIDLLNQMNGFEFDGCILYGIKVKNNNGNVFDLFQYNEIWYKTFDKKTYTFLGESNICWYAYNKVNQKYHSLDMPSGDILNEYDTLDDMLEMFFREICI